MEKQNKILSISILALAVFCLVGYLIYNILYNVNEQKTLPVIKEEKEKLIVSELEKVDIRHKANLIITHDYTANSNSSYEDNYISNIYGFIGNENLINNLSLTADEKLAVAINLLPRNPLTIGSESIHHDFVKSQLATTIFWQVRETDVDKNMLNLFGKKAPHKDIQGCPNYYYDSVNKVYYGSAECGGITPGFVYLYMSDYKKIDKTTITANIYLALAAENIDNNVSIYKSYEGFKSHITESKIDFYKTAKYPFEYTNNSKQYVGDFTINELNKKDFQKYKLTFKKNTDGTYYFDSIKR